MKKIKFLFILLGIVLYMSTRGSVGYPIISNYTSGEMKVTPQVWSIVQDEMGMIYLATNAGVLKFDGVNFQLYKTPNNSAVRSLAIDKNNTIFVGATRQFGMLKINTSGKYEYISLSDSISNVAFNAVLKTFVIGDATYFFANHKYIFKYQDHKIEEINIGDIDYFRAFKVNQEIYLMGSFGVAKLINDKVVIKDSKQTPGSVYFLLPYGTNTLMAGTLRDGIYLYHRKLNKWESFKTEIDPDLYKGDVYTGIILRNGNYAITTLKKGLFVITRSGELIQRFTNESGIINNGIYYLYEDKYHDLWAGQEKGVSHIELSTPFTKFGNKSGLDGTLQTAVVYEGDLYCATSNGIYYKDFHDPHNNKFQLIDPNYIYNLDLCKTSIPGSSSNILLASCLRDLLWVTPENELVELIKIYGCYSICPSPKIPGRFYLGSPSGLEYVDLQMNNGRVTVVKHSRVKKINESIRNIVCSDDGNMWIRTGFNSIIEVQLSKTENLDSLRYKLHADLNYTYPELIINSLNYIDEKVFIATNFGVFSLNILSDNKHTFSPETGLGLNFEKDSLSVTSIAKDKMGNYWLGLQEGLVKYDLNKSELVKTKYKRLSGKETQYINSLDGFGTVALTEDEMFFVNGIGQKSIEFNFKVAITRMVFGKDYKTLYMDSLVGNHIRVADVIPNNENSVIFEFVAPFYQKAAATTYSYFLQGFDKNWTLDTDLKRVSYTNLPHGNYTFLLKAKNIYGTESDVLSVKFAIEPPRYFRTIFIIAFVLLAILLVYLIVLIYTYRLNADRKRLQKRIDEAINKEQKQKEEIEIQADKLKLANKELENLSLVASKTDSAVIIMDAHGKIQWVNEGYTKLYGYKLYDILNKDTKIVGDHANVSLDAMVNVWFGERKPIIYENQKQTKTGEKVWVQTTLTPILDKSRSLIKLIAIDSDISKLKQAEAEIEAQKAEIEAQRDLAVEQRDEISIQKKEIVDSIRYANRIQKAILLNEDGFLRIFPKSFVYNKPRDIVSGDFYWAFENEDIKVIACVDCTGHGVPGAFMSFIGVTYLNYIVKEKHIYEPAEILNRLRDRVIQSLGQTGKENEANDGMDLSLCVFNKNARKLIYAGANNPIYHIRNKSELIELEADKMPISIFHSNLRNFKQGEIIYNSGDRIYLFTDGYADQFGGSHEKKFKSKRFKELLLHMQNETIANQKEELHIQHLNWRRDLAQVDDILVIGLELE